MFYNKPIICRENRKYSLAIKTSMYQKSSKVFVGFEISVGLLLHIATFDQGSPINIVSINHI